MQGSCRVDFSNFTRKCEASITSVNVTKEVIIEEIEALAAESLSEVPRDTNTLANSAYTSIEQTGTRIEATFGYGGNGDPYNPLSRRRASEYMVKVHEDLSANHIIGKAKFLEDPFNRRKFQVTAKVEGRFRSMLRRIWGR